MARSHWRSVRRSSRPARMASSEYARAVSNSQYVSSAYSKALGYTMPFGMSTFINGAWGVYNFKKTYGRNPRYVTPFGPVNRARRGMVSVAPHDVSRYYR